MNYSFALVAALLGVAGAVAVQNQTTLTFLRLDTNCSTRHTSFRYRLNVPAGQSIASVSFGLPSGTPVISPQSSVSLDTATGLRGVRFALPALSAGVAHTLELVIVVNDVYTVGNVTWAAVRRGGSTTPVRRIQGPAALVAPPVDTTEPETLTFNMIIHDFGVHPDFETFGEDDRGMVLPQLGADGTPTYAGGSHPTVTSNAPFYEWFHDSPVNQRFVVPLTAHRVAGSRPAVYEYDNQQFFPIDGRGFGNNHLGHNFGFTMMISTLFTYRGGETFYFRGDDDIWVFINRTLVIDLGGVHRAEESSVNLDTLGLNVNQSYYLDLFFCERHTVDSSFRMSTSLRLQDCTRDVCGLCVGSCEADTDGDGLRDCVDPHPFLYDSVCGDGVCTAYENCSVCPRDCGQCDCPDLHHVEAQHLRDPPTHNVTLGVVHSDDIDLSISLPQMIPHRWNVHSAFINPTTFETTQVGLPMQEGLCRYTHRSTQRLPELIRTAQPRIIEEDDRYRLQFLIRVWCNERFTLENGESYDRNSTFDLSFEVVFFRRAEVHSVISTMSARLVWGYIEKFSVMVPLDHSSPTVEFELITVVEEQDFAIVPATFVVHGTEGHIISVSTPAYMGLVDSTPNRQRWHLRATIDQYSICSTTASDRFTLNYTISSSRPQSANHASSLVASLEGLENWCMLDSDVRLNGAQSTHADTTSSDETVRFFVGDVVHVRDHVFTDLVLSQTELRRVVLSGSALRTATNLTLFDASSPLSSPLGFSAEQCPPSADATWVCYSFLLADTHFNVNNDLRIVSTISADVNQHPARRPGTPATTARVTSTLALSPSNSEPAGAAAAPMAAVGAATQGRPILPLQFIQRFVEGPNTDTFDIRVTRRLARPCALHSHSLCVVFIR
eukprot:m51a1_g14670 hypothetical protein (893) ;mRNA; f:34438-37917